MIRNHPSALKQKYSNHPQIKYQSFRPVNDQQYHKEYKEFPYQKSPTKSHNILNQTQNLPNFYKKDTFNSKYNDDSSSSSSEESKRKNYIMEKEKYNTGRDHPIRQRDDREIRKERAHDYYLPKNRDRINQRYIKQYPQGKYNDHERRSRSRSKKQRKDKQYKTYKQHKKFKQHRENSHERHFHENILGRFEIKNLQIYSKQFFIIFITNLDHYFFISDENSNVTPQVAIQNFITAYGLKPLKIMIICENQKGLNQLYRYQGGQNCLKKIFILDEQQDNFYLFKQFDTIVKQNDIIMLTQEKSSIILGLAENNIHFFDIVINFGKSNSVEYYSVLHQFLIDFGTIFSIFEDKKEVEKYDKNLKIILKEFNGQISLSEIHKDIFNQIQFMDLKSPSSMQKSQTTQNSSGPDSLTILSSLKTLTYPIQQTAFRLFQIIAKSHLSTPIRSPHLNRQGFITYSIHTDTQFNSIKYIWNFIREELSPQRVKTIKDMQKFDNQRGVVFNIPQTQKWRWQGWDKKIKEDEKKFKGYKLKQIMTKNRIPKLQDVESQEYKNMQAKKDEALKNRAKLELFIAGVPYDVNQVEIRRFFAGKGVNLFLVRILRDVQGFSKGISFGLAESQEHFQRAICLNGEKFGDRIMRIKLAEQKEHREQRDERRQRQFRQQKQSRREKDERGDTRQYREPRALYERREQRERREK